MVYCVTYMQTWLMQVRHRTLRVPVSAFVKVLTYRTWLAVMLPLRAASANEATTLTEASAWVSEPHFRYLLFHF